MGKFVDLSGQVFGRLTVLHRAENYGTSARFMCRCECGTTRPVMAKNLRKGATKSCGCLNNEGKTKHGLSQNCSTYKIWAGMKQRCTNSGHAAYRHYGARGITCCDRWLESFENFFSDMGIRPDGLTLERKDNDKGYSPENCKWATWVEQRHNQREHTNTTLVLYEGIQLTIRALSEKVGMPRYLLSDRIHKLRWTVEKAINTPAQGATQNESC